MAQVIISYRRADSAGITGRIRDRLVNTYGASSVFMDVEDIPFGIDFRDHVRSVLLRSDLLLVVVGREWLGKTETGTRIQSETDPVRIEVETALQNAIPVIPVLVNGALIPEPEDLPESLTSFAFLNAATVDAGRDFHVHMDRLETAIAAVEAARRGKPLPGQNAGTKPRPSRLRVGGLSAAAVLLAVILLGGAGWWFLGSPSSATQHAAGSGNEKAIGAAPASATSAPAALSVPPQTSPAAQQIASTQTAPARAVPSTVAGTYLAEAKAGCGTQRQSVKVAIRDGRVSWQHDVLDTPYKWEGTIAADGTIKAAVADHPNLQAVGRYQLDGREIVMTYPQCGAVTMLIGQMLSR
jgi:hypothetical protein